MGQKCFQGTRPCSVWNITAPSPKNEVESTSLGPVTFLVTLTGLLNLPRGSEKKNDKKLVDRFCKIVSRCVDSRLDVVLRLNVTREKSKGLLIIRIYIRGDGYGQEILDDIAENLEAELYTDTVLQEFAPRFEHLELKRASSDPTPISSLQVWEEPTSPVFQYLDKSELQRRILGRNNQEGTPGKTEDYDTKHQHLSVKKSYDDKSGFKQRLMKQESEVSMASAAIPKTSTLVRRHEQFYDYSRQTSQVSSAPAKYNLTRLRRNSTMDSDISRRQTQNIAAKSSSERKTAYTALPKVAEAEELPRVAKASNLSLISPKSPRSPKSAASGRTGRSVKTDMVVSEQMSMITGSSESVRTDTMAMHRLQEKIGFKSYADWRTAPLRTTRRAKAYRRRVREGRDLPPRPCFIEIRKQKWVVIHDEAGINRAKRKGIAPFMKYAIELDKHTTIIEERNIHRTEFAIHLGEIATKKGIRDNLNLDYSARIIFADDNDRGELTRGSVTLCFFEQKEWNRIMHSMAQIKSRLDELRNAER